MKIVVIGAGQGGLQAARTLARGNADVTVYEKCSREKLGYDWHDDCAASIFDEFGIPLPEGQYFRGDAASLVAPFSDKPLRVAASESHFDWAIERRALSAALVSLAEQSGAKIFFDSPADSLLIENGKVCGIVAGGESIRADLVIDSSGALSPFRASLPKSYHIQAQPAPSEVFRVYRAFMSRAPGVEMPAHPKKVYLKHIGEMGISWCMVEPSGEVNILVGRTDELSGATLSNALDALRKDNPIIGDDLLRGGIKCTIPIRYPLSRMVGDGYAAVGDAAFMTIPLIGSGIANSIRAGQMLAETVLETNSAETHELWKYQVRYFNEIGAEHVCVDLIKRMLLATDADDIRYLFDNGVIDENDMQSISSGEAMVMTPAKIIRKIIRGRRKLPVLLKLKSAIASGEKGEAFAHTIPCDFDKKSVAEWQQKLDGLFE